MKGILNRGSIQVVWDTCFTEGFTSVCYCIIIVMNFFICQFFLSPIVLTVKIAMWNSMRN